MYGIVTTLSIFDISTATTWMERGDAVTTAASASVSTECIAPDCWMRNKESLAFALAAWRDSSHNVYDAGSAAALYGQISGWQTRQISDMSFLFSGAEDFNEVCFPLSVPSTRPRQMCSTYTWKKSATSEQEALLNNQKCCCRT